MWIELDLSSFKMTFQEVIFPASQMKLWILNAVVLSLFCSVCLSAKSTQVDFISRNFKNTLNWTRVEPAIPGENITYKYSVEYKRHADGEEYRKKAGCQNITVLFCDLTNETPVIPDGHYWARVFVNGQLHGTTKKRFTPLTQTILGPPTVSTKPTVSGLHVEAILPLGPNGESIADIIARSNNGSYKHQVSYILEITDPKMAQWQNKTGHFNLKLNSSRVYCGHVFYKSSKCCRLESEKAFFCYKLPADPLNLLPWLILSAVCLLALLIMSFLCACKYVKASKVSKPTVLMMSKTPTKVLVPQNDTISIPELNVHLQNAKRNFIQMKPSVPPSSLGGYSPQDIPCQISQDSSLDTTALRVSSDPKDSSAQSSVSYGAVAVQDHEDQGAFKDPEISNRWPLPGVECVSKSHEMTSVMAVQDGLDSNPNRPLLLHTVRDLDGNLVLRLCSFQFQSSTDNLQRRPLLSDLEQSSLSSLENLDKTELSECDDSRPTSPMQTCCNSHYTQRHVDIPNPHQGNLNSSSTDGRSESCYKQNWIPEVSVETVSTHSDSDKWTDCPPTWNGLTKEEIDTEEDREGLENFPLSGHFLGNWGPQIQD